MDTFPDGQSTSMIRKVEIEFWVWVRQDVTDLRRLRGLLSSWEENN